MQKSPLFKRMFALAKRLLQITDDLIGLRGELVDIAEYYETERAFCPRCGAKLDERGVCSEHCDRQEDVT